MAHHQVTSTME